jgi:hypothetical protein
LATVAGEIARQHTEPSVKTSHLEAEKFVAGFTGIYSDKEAEVEGTALGRETGSAALVALGAGLKPKHYWTALLLVAALSGLQQPRPSAPLNSPLSCLIA